MSIKMKELPIAERPYEKLEVYGAEHLSNAELLAIIIKCGTKNNTALNLAQDILKLKENSSIDNLSFLQEISIEEFKKIKGIGTVKAIQLKAICELAKRMVKPMDMKHIVLHNSQEVGKLLMQEMKYEAREIAKVILLNTKNRVLKIKDIAIRRNEFCGNRT